MSRIDYCKYCKHNRCSVTYSLIWGGEPISHRNVCKITHKEKADTDTCKRFKYNAVFGGKAC